MTLTKSNQDHLDTYLTNPNLRPVTLKGYRSVLTRFGEAIGRKPWKHVTAEDVQRWLSIFSNPKTKKTFLGTIKVFLKWVHQGNLPHDIHNLSMRNAMRHHQRLQADDLLTNKEVERLVDACNSFRDKTLVMLLYGTGCRIGELLSARLKDIIDHHGQTALRVKGKTGEHYYYIAYAALPYLNQYLASLSTADPEDRLFPLAYRSIHGLLARAANRAGINKRVYPHLFRHMRNIYLIKKVGKDKAKMIMGYASTSSEIDNYLHLIEQDTTAAFLESEGHPTEEQVTLDPELQLPEPVECPRCHFVNIVGSNFCARCTLPFHGDVAEEETMAEKMERLENTVQTLMNVIARKMGVE